MANRRKAVEVLFDLVTILVILACWGLAIWAYARFIWPMAGEGFSFRLGEEQTVRILSPRWLGLALVVPSLWLVGKWTLSDLPWLQRLANVILRSLLVICLCLAVSRVVLTRFESRVAVVFVVDVSESVPDELLAQARERIQQAYERRGTHTVRVITFAREAQELPIPPGSREVPTLHRHSGPAAGLQSNLASALQLSYGLFPPDHLKRVVVISDGHFNRGDGLSAAFSAARHGIRIDSLEIALVPADEVLLRSVHFPDSILANEPFHVTVDVFATFDGEIRLDLTQNDLRDIRGRRFAVQAGETVQLDLVVEVYEPGRRTFQIDIRSERDRFADNNRIIHTVEVAGRPQVLYVEGESRRSSYLSRALDDERNSRVDFDLEVRSASGFPQRLEEMQNFDLIILSDVEAAQIPRDAMSALRSYVRDQGGSFLMIGGENSLGPGGYAGSAIEELLPVTLESRRSLGLPSVALMLVVDRSGSMEGLKLEMAKDAARASVELLGPQDRVGVIAFDTAPQQVVRMQSASNLVRIQNDIARISPGGGTDIYSALEEAFLELAQVRASTRHVILLTDGVSPRGGIAELVDQMRSERISVSTVGVGRDVDRDLLEMIADLASGRYYYTNDPQAIPQIFVRETSRVGRSSIVEEPFRPTVVTRSLATSGIDFAGAPYLLGYVSTRARSRATVELATDLGEPLYAHWRYGRGRTAVFTSDCKNRWMVEWLVDPIYPRFWAQVARSLMREREQAAEQMAIQVSAVDGRGQVLVDAVAPDDSFINRLDSEIRITAPSGEEQQITLRQTAAGRYQGSFDLPEYGSYLVTGRHHLEGRITATSLASLANPYPDEYLVVGADHTLTRQAVALSGGHINPSARALFDPEGETIPMEQEVWPYFLFAALGLLVIDILLRRIRLYGRTALTWGMVKRR
ncbi:MAG: VWA domain-containing protein [Bradymonadales bacterium]|nr:VWA domain-containing protein [Bradymonadales bacterium]